MVQGAKSNIHPESWQAGLFREKLKSQADPPAPRCGWTGLDNSAVINVAAVCKTVGEYFSSCRADSKRLPLSYRGLKEVAALAWRWKFDTKMS
jgi:hypothetical protein